MPLSLAALAVLAGCGQAPTHPPDVVSTAPNESAADAIAAAPLETRRVEAWIPVARTVDFGRTRVSPEVRKVAEWAARSDDHHGLPFLVVDKAQARVVAFDAEAHLVGSAPALLGLARGDDSVPGIGERRIADIRPEERTTPAGRFAAEMGVNTGGEDILWVDYDNAISMHRVRANNPAERRLQRLASPSAADNRISYGCINLPVAFYEKVVKALFAPHNGIVYVLPETRPASAVFDLSPAAPTALR
jgi:hypothetical protein